MRFFDVLYYIKAFSGKKQVRRKISEKTFVYEARSFIAGL